MKVTLLDEQGVELTEVSSRVGRPPGQMLVDWATRPDVLFKYYFDRGRRTVTMVNNAERYRATLGTRWQMGVRFWFLHMFNPVPGAPLGPREASMPGGSDTLRLPAVRAGSDLDAPTVARASEPLSVPA